jgi:hypothetical protein
MANDSTAMSTPMRTVIAAGGGTLLGLILSSLGGPALISWWYEPPSRDAFSCAGSVKTALSQFVTFQVSCALVGGIAIAIGYFFVQRAIAKKREAKA